MDQTKAVYSGGRVKRNRLSFLDICFFYLSQSLVEGCGTCSKLFDADGNVKLPEPIVDPESVNPKLIDSQRQVRELELELAQTKLMLVESQCKTQDLTHSLNSAVTEIQASKNTWFTKTLNSIKEVTNTHSTKKEVKD